MSSTPGRSPLWVSSVGRSSTTVRTSRGTSTFPPERSLLCAVTVGRPSPTAPLTFYIGPTLESKECGKSFTNRKDLICHFSIHTGEKLYECVQCGKAFPHMSGLTGHKWIHSGEKPLECMECGKSFCWSTNLIWHAIIHTGEKPCKCSECRKAFSCRLSLTQHQRMCSGRNPVSVAEEGPPFICAHTSFILMGKDFLNVKPREIDCRRKNPPQRLIIHTKEKPHKCLHYEKLYVLSGHSGGNGPSPEPYSESIQERPRHR
ncbi:Zinc finger protein 264 [Sciurus carolinensis]|uniref:Zinc finger protein 264 n=1 Tax=Sciurus carolinensis TaxID=30640 RepID=A0AA41MDL8_SCICA|nr:Zinc finger protein 264 [Sciurus carolinensis]